MYCEKVEVRTLGAGSNGYSPGVSGNGVVAFGADVLNDTAYRYSDALGRQSLGPLLGTPLGGAGHSDALAASEDGSVIVGSADALRTPPLLPIRTPFRWTPGSGMQAMLQTDGNLFNGGATSVAADGLTIVGTQFGGANIFRWTQTTRFQLITPFAPATGVFEPAISGDGNTIIVHDTLWTAATGPLHLTDVLTAAGCGFTGWTISGATGISFDGRVLCGEGIDPQGQREAWIATVPAPGTLLPLAALVVGARRRR